MAHAQRLAQIGSWAYRFTDEVHWDSPEHWSQELWRITGFDPAKGFPPNEAIFLRIHPEDRERVAEATAQAVSSGRPLDVKYRFFRGDGTLRVFHTIGTRTQENDTKRYVGATIDITEQERVLEELKRSEFYLAEGQRLGHAGSWSFKPDLTCDYWSRELYQILGFDPRKGIPTISDYLTRVHPEDREIVEATIRRMVATGEGCDLKKRIIRPDRAQRVIRCVGMPVGESGVVTRFVGTLMDITEQEELTEEVRRREMFLAEGQRLSHTGSWGWNAATGKLAWSEEHFRILGLDPQHTSPSLNLFWERIHPDDRAGLQRTFESAIRDKRDFEQEFRIVRPDWSIRHLHGVGHAVLNNANELVEFIGSTMDITERKRAEERAKSQEAAIRFALSAFVEELDVDRLLKDVICELNKQFHPKSLEIWLFDEILNELSRHSSSQSAESSSQRANHRNTRRLDELKGYWQPGSIGRAPQVFLGPQHLESLKAQEISTVMIVPLVLGEQNLGFLELHFQSPTQFTSGDLELAQALANHATLALQLNRLTRRAEQLAVTEERNRLAREIHDTLAQSFAGIVLHGEVLGSSLGANKVRSKRALSQMQKLARSGLDEARRSVQALRPKALDGTALPEALEQAALRLRDETKLSCQFRQLGKRVDLSTEIQNELFRIAQEALNNVVKHAQAKSVCITLQSGPRRTSLSIKDDGIGLATAKRPNRCHGFGMGTMRERAQGIGGRLRVESRAGRGTTIRVEVPSAASNPKRK